MERISARCSRKDAARRSPRSFRDPREQRSLLRSRIFRRSSGQQSAIAGVSGDQFVNFFCVRKNRVTRVAWISSRMELIFSWLLGDGLALTCAGAVPPGTSWIARHGLHGQGTIEVLIKRWIQLTQFLQRQILQLAAFVRDTSAPLCRFVHVPDGTAHHDSPDKWRRRRRS